jgi:hypothetical protein
MRKWYMDLEKVITLTHSKFTHSIINWLLLIFLFKAFSDVFSKLILKVEQTSRCAYQKTSWKIFVIIVTPNQSENRKDYGQVIEDI